jgi:hypothetical protein
VKRILITGSRDWTDAAVIEDALRPFWTQWPSAILVHGDAKGADKMASAIWRGWGGQDEAHPAAWATLGKRAGYVRNAEMVALGADVCLAFIRHHSRGASMTADLATEAGIHVHRYEE